MRSYGLVVAMTLLFLSPTTLAAATRPSDTELSAVSARGRALAEYDTAAWRSSDALEAIGPDTSDLGRFVALKGAKGWLVAFGRLNAQRDAFIIPYEAVENSDRETYSIKPQRPALHDTGFFLMAARAVDLALRTASVVRGYNYNYAVLPAESGQLWVYIYPARTKVDTYVLGGDTRFLISADGNQIVETRRMHRGIIEFRSEPSSGQTLAAGTHTAILADEPEDTDVYYVLTRLPLVPEYVATQDFTYRIETSGSITFLGAH